MLYILLLYMRGLCIRDAVCKHLLKSSTNPRHVFWATFVEKLHNENETDALLTSSRVNGHLLKILLIK